VDYLNRLGLLDRLTIAVHLLNADTADLDIIGRSGAKVVLCPRSNMNLHGRLPDLPGFLSMDIKPALGTDSLASNESMSIFDEMAFVSDHYPGIDPGEIVAMATIYGARALGMEGQLGTLEKEKTGDFIYLPIETKNSKQLLERITGYEQ